jgi:hypothetical protein
LRSLDLDCTTLIMPWALSMSPTLSRTTDSFRGAPQRRYSDVGIFSGAFLATLSSAMICSKRSKPYLVKAVTPRRCLTTIDATPKIGRTQDLAQAVADFIDYGG